MISAITHQKAVAPIIATLLMVAIAVVGGTIIFVFSQGFFGQTQNSGAPTIEYVKILGYDARDVANLNAHDEVTMTAVSSDPGIQGKNAGERIVVYVRNDSVKQILFSEISLGGEIYSYNTENPIPAFTPGNGGNYGVLTNSTHMKPNQDGIAEPGETVGILIELNEGFPIGRDTQFKLTTANGAVFVGTVAIGQNIG